MTSEQDVRPGNPPRGFSFLFLVALMLATASLALNFGFALFSQQLFQSGLVEGRDFQLYSLAQSLASFLFSPVISFLVFYKVGSSMSVKTISDHFRVLTNAFAGGATGYAIGFAGLTAYLWMAQGSSSFGANTDWLLESAQLILEFAQAGIGIAFVAFAGVVVGFLRSSAKGPRAASPNSETPDGALPQAVLNDSPHPQVDSALGLSTTKPPPICFSDL